MALEGFREGRISIRELREYMNNLYKRALDLFEEHMKIEETVFKSMIGNESS